MSEQVIVGAGLSGLVAAITLARRGHNVRVLEKYKTVGGQPERWPAVDVTPMAPRKLSQYLGIPIGEPQVKSCVKLDAFLWGQSYHVPIKNSNLCCVERGPRETSLDGYLYGIARKLGVQFEFDHPVLGQGELASLPPDTIVATGLYAESFDALNIPYQMGWCFGAKGRSDRDSEAQIFFGDYTTDYGYCACMNGIDMVFLFRRGPIGERDLLDFQGEVESALGRRVDDWLAGYGPTPTASFGNPRLFASDKILAGTLSGMIEPFVLFGVHGALVSGHIAALAIEDRYKAWVEFNSCLYAWKRGLLNRRIFEHLPAGFRRRAVQGLNASLEEMGPDRGSSALEKGFVSVPGYLKITKGSTRKWGQL